MDKNPTVRDPLLREPLESWRCKSCKNYIDYCELKIDPGKQLCDYCLYYTPKPVDKPLA